MAELTTPIALATQLVTGPADIAESMRLRELPSVTVYNRLEGRPRTRAFDRSLRAEVRDPLWMLTRQWQVGEFQADDAGSPVLSQLHLRRTELTELGPREFPVVPFDDPLPLETRVERRPVPLRLGGVPVALDLRLALGRRFERWLAAPGSGLTADYTVAFRDAYPVTVPDPDDAADAGRAAHASVWQAFAAVAGRVLDGGALIEHLVGPPAGAPYDGVVAVADADKPLLDVLGQRLVEWFRDLVVPASAPELDAWDAQRLEYRFRAAAPNADGSARRYFADGYHGGRLDWWHLDLDAADTSPLAAPDPSVVVETTTTTVPSPVTFAGMPNTRWWAFEDGRTNLGAVDAATSDVATLLFLEFALVFANDWFLTQVQLPVGSIAEVRGLAVTNVFGERFWVTPPALATTTRGNAGRCSRPVSWGPGRPTPRCSCSRSRRRCRRARSARRSRSFGTRWRTWSGGWNEPCRRARVAACLARSRRPRRLPSSAASARTRPRFHRSWKRASQTFATR